jgi:uncharacterized protein
MPADGALDAVTGAEPQAETPADASVPATGDEVPSPPETDTETDTETDIEPKTESETETETGPETVPVDAQESAAVVTAEQAEVRDPGGGEHPRWIVVKVRSIKVEFPSPHALVMLREVEEPRRDVTIAIGFPEATALGYAWHQVPTPRPLTHALFCDVLARLGATIEVVRLTGRQAGVVSAEMELSSPRGRELVPCRPTDGLTLSLRQGVRAPILVDERLFDPDADVTPGADKG